MGLSKTEIIKVVNNIDFNKCVEHPNILIAARIWEDDRYNAARVCYKFMRKLDDLVDDRKAINSIFSASEKEMLTATINYWISNLGKMAVDDPFMNDVNEVIAKFRLPAELFHTFSNSMIYDVNNNGFDSIESFLTYAEGASVVPASVFVHLCCLNKKGNEYIAAPFNIVDLARPCAIFSYLVHIIRDFQKDQLNNLNYFALDILKKYGLESSDLRKMAEGAVISDEFRGVINDYCKIAESYKLQTLSAIEKLEHALAPEYLLSLKVIYSLYLQVYERIDVENGSFTTSELNPGPYEIKERVLQVIDEFDSF